MALVAVTLSCKAGGFSVISWSTSCIRTGSANDKAQFRIMRTGPGADVVLSGAPNVALREYEDTKSYQWVDTDIPTDGTYTYKLQIYRITGAGQFNEMTLTGQHFKK